MDICWSSGITIERAYLCISGEPVSSSEAPSSRRAKYIFPSEVCTGIRWNPSILNSITLCSKLLSWTSKSVRVGMDASIFCHVEAVSRVIQIQLISVVFIISIFISFTKICMTLTTWQIYKHFQEWNLKIYILLHSKIKSVIN